MGFFTRKKKEEPVRCPNCRNTVKGGSVFCDACGMRIMPAPKCGKCNLPLAPDTNFCEACGTPVGTLGDIPSPAGKDQPAAAQGKKRKKNGGGRKKVSGEKQDAADEAGPAEEPWGDDSSDGPDRHDTCGPPAPHPHDRAGARPFAIIPSLRSAGSQRHWAVAAAVLVLGIFLLCAVLSGPQHPGPVPPSPETGGEIPGESPGQQNTEEHQASPPVMEAGESASLIPGPTRVVPDSLRIWLQADRDPVTHRVSVRYDGGKGQRAVREVTARLTRSDGGVRTGSFRPLVIGEGVILEGTQYTDRLEVTIIYNSGETYTVIDKLFEHKVRN